MKYKKERMIRSFGYAYLKPNWNEYKIVEFLANTEAEANVKALRYSEDYDVFIQPLGESLKIKQ